jgi:hypothetical protein
MNKKLKQLASDLQDGGVITDYLEHDAIALLGRLSYEEIKESLGNHDNAQDVFWAAAQYLAGNPDKFDLIDKADGVTPQDCANDYLRQSPAGEVLA